MLKNEQLAHTFGWEKTLGAAVVLSGEVTPAGPVLTPAAAVQTDDEGHYRLWGLMPGDYYVNAVTRLNFGGLGGRGGELPPGLVPLTAL